MATNDEINRAFYAHNRKKACSVCPYQKKQEANGLCVDQLLEDAENAIRKLKEDNKWHPFPTEKPSDGALVWVHAPSALMYWGRYNYAEYRYGTFWRGAERVDNVAAWMPVKEADHEGKTEAD